MTMNKNMQTGANEHSVVKKRDAEFQKTEGQCDIKKKEKNSVPGIKKKETSTMARRTKDETMPSTS